MYRLEDYADLGLGKQLYKLSDDLEFEIDRRDHIEIQWYYRTIPLARVYDNRIRVLNNPGIYIIEMLDDPALTKPYKVWRPIYGGKTKELRSRLGKDHKRAVEKFKANPDRYRVRFGTLVNPPDDDNELERRIKIAEHFLIRTLVYIRHRWHGKASKNPPFEHITNMGSHDARHKPFAQETLIVLKGRTPRYIKSAVRKAASRSRGRITVELNTQKEQRYLFSQGVEYEFEDDSNREPGPNQSSRLASMARKAILWASLVVRSLNPEPPSGRFPEPPSVEQRKERKNRGSQYELEWEAEPEPTVRQKQKIDARLEDLAYAAAAAQTEAEAEALVGAMVPLAAQLIPRVKPLMMTSSPAMVAGLGAATRLLHENRRTRPLLRTMPTILHHTAAVLNRQMLNGQKPTPKGAVKVLANQAGKVIDSPTETRRALQHAREMSHHH